MCTHDADERVASRASHDFSLISTTITLYFLLFSFHITLHLASEWSRFLESPSLRVPVSFAVPGHSSFSSSSSPLSPLLLLLLLQLLLPSHMAPFFFFIITRVHLIPVIITIHSHSKIVPAFYCDRANKSLRVTREYVEEMVNLLFIVHCNLCFTNRTMNI